MKTAEGGGVLALTGVRDRRNRHLSAVFDLYSPFKLLKIDDVFSTHDTSGSQLLIQAILATVSATLQAPG